jgi:Stabilization of polarity axis
MKFGERTMLLFDALLSEKRILFSGGLEHSAAEIGEYVMACSRLIGGIGGIAGRVYPYAALSNLEFLEENGYLAGVTNPVFKTRAPWYDLCAEVDIGKLKVSKNENFYNYETEPYYQVDLEFIKPIISRLKHNEAGSSENELERAFESYTQLIVDFSLLDSDSGLTHYQ